MSNVVSLQAFGSNRALQTIVETASSDQTLAEPKSSLSQKHEPTHPPYSARSGMEECKSCTSDSSDRIDEGLPSPQRDSGPPSLHAGPRPSSKAQASSQYSDGSDNTSAQIASPRASGTFSTAGSHTEATSTMPRSFKDEQSDLEEHFIAPLDEYDLAAPVKDGDYLHSLETLSGLLYAADHLKNIFADPSLLLDFTSFLSACRPQSVPMLMYYLDATEAVKAVNYAITIAKTLEPIPGHDFTSPSAEPTWNVVLEQKAEEAFAVLVQEDLPAFVTQVYVQTVKSVMIRRTTGPPLPSTREGLKGMLEAFCLTDPSRSDNPIVFASEAFHRMTEYSIGYVIGRNCRFLQGPKTNQASIARIRKAVEEGLEHCELILNYRRDGSPFMNLLMLAPLRDVNGKIRYCLGAQVDVSDLVPDSVDSEGRASMPKVPQVGFVGAGASSANDKHSDNFQELEEAPGEQGTRNFNRWKASTVKDDQDDDMFPAKHEGRRPGLHLRSSFTESVMENDAVGWVNNKLSGFYQNYLLIRPYPSLRVLFASPSLHTPGILQSPIMEKIALGSTIRDDLLQALSQCRSVTVKVRWVLKPGDRGRRRWIAFTPLIGSHMQAGVWVAVLVDDGVEDQPKLRQGPPVRYRLSDANQASSAPRLPVPTSKEPATGASPAIAPAPAPEKPLSIRDRSVSRRKESPPPSPKTPSANSSIAPLVPEIDEAYETLEERLLKKRAREAARLHENPTPSLRPTYKSLSPYVFMNNDEF